MLAFLRGGFPSTSHVYCQFREEFTAFTQLVVAAGILAGGVLPGHATVMYVNDAGGNLGTVDTTTGAVMVIGFMGFDTMTDIAFNPLGNLYGLGFSNFHRINKTTGAVTYINFHGVSGANALVFGSNGTAMQRDTPVPTFI